MSQFKQISRIINSGKPATVENRNQAANAKETKSPQKTNFPVYAPRARWAKHRGSKKPTNTKLTLESQANKEKKALTQEYCELLKQCSKYQIKKAWPAQNGSPNDALRNWMFETKFGELYLAWRLANGDFKVTKIQKKTEAKPQFKAPTREALVAAENAMKYGKQKPIARVAEGLKPKPEVKHTGMMKSEQLKQITQGRPLPKIPQQMKPQVPQRPKITVPEIRVAKRKNNNPKETQPLETFDPVVLRPIESFNFVAPEPTNDTVVFRPKDTKPKQVTKLKIPELKEPLRPMVPQLMEAPKPMLSRPETRKSFDDKPYASLAQPEASAPKQNRWLENSKQNNLECWTPLSPVIAPNQNSQSSSSSSSTKTQVSAATKGTDLTMSSIEFNPWANMESSFAHKNEAPQILEDKEIQQVSLKEAAEEESQQDFVVEEDAEDETQQDVVDEDAAQDNEQEPLVGEKEDSESIQESSLKEAAEDGPQQESVVEIEEAEETQESSVEKEDDEEISQQEPTVEKEDTEDVVNVEEEQEVPELKPELEVETQQEALVEQNEDAEETQHESCVGTEDAEPQEESVEIKQIDDDAESQHKSVETNQLVEDTEPQTESPVAKDETEDSQPQLESSPEEEIEQSESQPDSPVAKEEAENSEPQLESPTEVEQSDSQLESPTGKDDAESQPENQKDEVEETEPQLNDQKDEVETQHEEHAEPEPETELLEAQEESIADSKQVEQTEQESQHETQVEEPEQDAETEPEVSKEDTEAESQVSKENTGREVQDTERAEDSKADTTKASTGSWPVKLNKFNTAENQPKQTVDTNSQRKSSSEVSEKPEALVQRSKLKLWKRTPAEEAEQKRLALARDLEAKVTIESVLVPVGNKIQQRLKALAAVNGEKESDWKAEKVRLFKSTPAQQPKSPKNLSGASIKARMSALQARGN